MAHAAHSSLKAAAFAALAVAACATEDAPAARCPEVGEAQPWLVDGASFSPADRGRLLRCAHVGTFTRELVAATAPYPPAVEPASNGYELFVVAYVSEVRSGVLGTVTGLVYAPVGGGRDLPTVALGHGTLGAGPTCGPSHVPPLTDPLAVPLVGRGHVVVAPDFAGNGADTGLTSYLVGTLEAAAMNDALRAVRALRDPRFAGTQLGADLFYVGHSQGGHAALFSHAAFDASLGFDLKGSVAFAPGLGSMRQWATLFSDERRPVTLLETFAVSALFAKAQQLGVASSSWLSTKAAELLPRMLKEQCLADLLTTMPAAFASVTELYQPSFLSAAKGCDFRGSCPAFEPWSSALVAEEPGRFTSAAPALLVAGLADIVVPPETTACIADRLRAAATPVETCAYAGADHNGTVAFGLADAMRWMNARRAGKSPPACNTPLTAPCPP